MSGAPIGVLALQGDFDAHARAVRAVGGEPVEIRTPGQLAAVRGLILPGGESTTLLRLVETYGFREAICDFPNGGGLLCGTCAGLILLAREVTEPSQQSLGLLDVSVRRNAYGRQVDSFVETGMLRWNGLAPEPAEMIFIRAPRITRIGPEVEVVGELNGEATFVRQDRVWGVTFHPELSEPSLIHRRFVEAAAQG